MSTRVPGLIHVRRQLIGLLHAHHGVLPSERAGMSWGWLEAMLPARVLPPGLLAAWNLPLPSGRVAVSRIVVIRELGLSEPWGVLTIVLERPQYDWFLGRAWTALHDESFWQLTRFRGADGVALPSWPDEPVPSKQQVDAARELAHRGQLRLPAIVAGNNPDADDRQVLRVPVVVTGDSRYRLRWAIGLPQGAPGALVATTRLVRQGIDPRHGAHDRQTDEAPEPDDWRETPPNSKRASYAAPPDPWHASMPEAPTAFDSSPDEAFLLQRKPVSRIQWLVPAICAVAGLAGVALAAWLMTRPSA